MFLFENPFYSDVRHNTEDRYFRYFWYIVTSTHTSIRHGLFIRWSVISICYICCIHVFILGSPSAKQSSTAHGARSPAPKVHTSSFLSSGVKVRLKVNVFLSKCMDLFNATLLWFQFRVLLLKSSHVVRTPKQEFTYSECILLPFSSLLFRYLEVAWLITMHSGEHLSLASTRQLKWRVGGWK